MKLFKNINIEKNDEQINIYLLRSEEFIDRGTEDIQLFLHEIKNALFPMFKKTIILTGEDIYGKDKFSDDVQASLEMENHIVTNSYYDGELFVNKDCNVINNILELNNVGIESFASLFSGPLFSFINILLIEDQITLQDIKERLGSSQNLEDLEHTLLEFAVIIYPRLDGTSIVIKCNTKYFTDIEILLNKFVKGQP